MPWNLQGNLRGRPFVCNVTVTDSGLQLLSAGLRTILNVAAPGVLITDILEIYPLALPAGYAIHHAIPTAKDRVSVTLNGPSLALGASANIACALYAVNRELRP